jgi:hypothetical protein
VAASPKKKTSKTYASGNTGLGTFAKPSKVAKKTLAKTTGANNVLPFIPGSRNHRLSKIEVNDSLSSALRVSNGDRTINVATDSQRWYKEQNSIWSGVIAKVRRVGEHKKKKFKMERGSFTTAGGDAIIFFVCVTRTE